MISGIAAAAASRVDMSGSLHTKPHRRGSGQTDAEAMRDSLNDIFSEIRSLNVGQGHIREGILQLAAGLNEGGRLDIGSMASNTSQDSGCQAGQTSKQGSPTKIPGKIYSILAKENLDLQRSHVSDRRIVTLNDEHDKVYVSESVSTTSVQGFSRGIGLGKTGRDKAWESHIEETGDGVAHVLPQNWPASLCLRKEFLEEHLTAEPTDSKAAGTKTVELRVSSASSDHELGTVAAPTPSTRPDSFSFASSTFLRSSVSGFPVPKKFALDPNAPLAITLDMIAVMVVMYEMLVTPYLLAWRVDTEGKWKFISYVTCVYWLFDICVACGVGFFDKTGALVLQQPQILRHYLRTWFIGDVLLIVIDVTVLLLLNLDSVSADSLRFGKLARMFKLFRLARLLRLLDKVASMNVSEATRAGILLAKVGGLTLLVNHFLTCAWFALGQERAGAGPSWLDQLDSDQFGHDGVERDPLWEYTTAFHWTLAQLTLGSNELIPTSSAERIFTIALMVFGLLYSSTLVSFFSAQVMHFLLLRQDKATQLANLKRYLRQNKVSNRLSAHIIQQVATRSFDSVPLRESDVEVIQSLTVSLRNEMRQEIHMPPLLTHPLFQAWCQTSPGAAAMLCCQGATVDYIARGDELFLPLERATQAFCLMRGTMDYLGMSAGLFAQQHCVHASLDKSFRRHRLLNEGDWLCEACLWMEWIHVGTAKAIRDCELLVLSADRLFEVLQKFHLLTRLTLRYARNFHKRVAAAVPPYAPHFPDDVKIPFCNPPELLSHEVGANLLQHAQETGAVSLTPVQQELLIKELEEGKCALELTHSGSLQRLVSVAVVWLQYEDEVFLQVATMENGETKVQCQLPGTKQATEELPALALRRLFHEVLHPFMGKADLEGARNSIERMESSTYGIPSVYFRTEFQMTLNEGEGDVNVPRAVDERGGPTLCLSGNEVDVPILTIRTEKKIYLGAWVQTEDLPEMSLPENVAAIRLWAEEAGIFHGEPSEMVDLI